MTETKDIVAEVSNETLGELIEKYEKKFHNREKVPVWSEADCLQLILLGRIWKILTNGQSSEKEIGK